MNIPNLYPVNPDQKCRRFVAGCFFLCCICLLVPIWTSGILPFTDYPVHLALIQASGFSISTPVHLAGRFEFHWFTPYTATYALARVLTLFLPVETTGKILLSLYLILTPLLFMRLLRLLGKPGYLAFPVFLMLYNFNLSWGFLPFLVAIPLLTETINRSVVFIRKTGLYNGFLLAILYIVLFFTHLFAWMTALCLYLGLIFAVLIRQRKKSAALLLPVIPAFGLAVVWRMALTLTESDAYFLEKGVRFAPLALKFRFFPDYVISGDPGWTTRIIFFCMAVLVIMRFVPSKSAGFRFPPTGSGRTPGPASADSACSSGHLCIGMVTAIWIFFLVCPYSWLTAVWLFNRTAFLAAAWVLVLLPVSSRLSSGFYVSAVTLLCIVLSFSSTRRFRMFERETQAGLVLLDMIPPEKELRHMAFNARSIFTDHMPYTHFGQYYQVRHNGFVHNPFAVLAHIPIRYRPAYMALESGFRSEPFRRQGRLHMDLAYERNDWFLMRLSASETPDIIAGIFLEQTSDLPVLVSHRGSWVLFSKHGGNR